MTTTAPRRSKWRIALGWFAALTALGIVALVVLGVVWIRWAHAPAPLVLSKETTFITGPVRPDGSINYVAALNKRYSQGVTRDNNGAVLFWRAVGPKDIVSGNREQFFKLLGMPTPAEKGDYFIPLDKFAEQKVAEQNFAEQNGEAAKVAEGIALPSTSAQEIWIEQLYIAMARPWSREEFPLLAQWLEANEKPLALVTEASRRQHWFQPLVPEDGTLMGANLTAIGASRETARTLAARAMLRTHLGQFEEAWDDIMTCHRLARLVGRGPTLVDGLVGFVVEGLACETDQSLLQHATLDSAQLEKMRRDLGQLDPFPAMVDKIDSAERFFLLDSALTVAREGGGMNELLAGLGDGGPNNRTAMDLDSIVTIDWNIVLRIGNSWFDKVVVALRLPERAQQRDALQQIDDELMMLGRGPRDFLSTSRSMLSDPQVTASQRVGEIFVTMMMPATMAVHVAEMKAEMRFELVKLGFALAAYRADHDSYPETLAELAPNYLAEIPIDVFSGAALHYDRRDEGYLLYSVGVNGEDDGGSGDSSKDHDDLVIRVPAPDKVKSDSK